MRNTLTESPIRIREIDDFGVPHPPAWGRFIAGELVYVIATLPNGRAKTWTREPREDAETFGARVTRDIVEQVRGQCVGMLVA
jgi:hypothetical protein